MQEKKIYGLIQTWPEQKEKLHLKKERKKIKDKMKNKMTYQKLKNKTEIRITAENQCEWKFMRIKKIKVWKYCIQMLIRKKTKQKKKQQNIGSKINC